MGVPKQSEKLDFVKSESTSMNADLLKHGLTSKDIIDIEQDPYGVQQL